MALRAVVIATIFGLAGGPARADPSLADLFSNAGDMNQAGARIILLVTVLALAPAFLAMVTSFTRIVVVLYFLRSGLGAQDIPPNQVLLGVALFLTFFSMRPTLQDVNEVALRPYFEGRIEADAALRNAEKPLRRFMFKHARKQDMALFVRLGRLQWPKTRADLPTSALIPAFVISELRTAFEIGFIIYLPFLVIDLVVASTLVSVGVFMLPPLVLSLPFKVLLFILVDGWRLLTTSLIAGFY
ncbi:MAG: flagellar type III secretion system pore protein FliP [Armatimonadota bacterium]